jgi:hypothetical protein
MTSKAGHLQNQEINKTKGPTERHQLSKVTGPQSVTVTTKGVSISIKATTHFIEIEIWKNTTN